MQKRYIALADTWLSHECRLVKAGQEFETDFPAGPGGRPMRLGDNLKEAPATKGKKAEDDGGKSNESLV